MKGFDFKFIEELKDKNDIVDIASRYVKLEQRGTNFWARCPFHHEKTASFCINSLSKFYYCFGCHKSGDVISFVMELESLDFYDAVKFLAARVGMELPELKQVDESVKKAKEQRDRLYAVMKETARFYAQNIREERGEEYLSYAYKRGLKPQTIIKFGIGASTDYESLPKHLKSLGFSYEDMVLAGAVGEKNGRYYDPLADRLIIPMIDQMGNVVAFSGRIIRPNDKAGKYVNTKGTPIFPKAKTLFNINNLKKLKNEKGIDSVIVVEGHLDAVSMSQAGIENVVASMGTALTKDHARILKRFSDKIYISYDGDAAGQEATLRGLDILGEEGLEVKVVSLVGGKDPDEIISAHGAEAYLDLVKNAKPLIDFKLDVLKKTYDVNKTDERRKFITLAVKVVAESPSFAEQEELLKTIRDMTGITFDTLKRELAAAKEGKPSVINSEKAETETPTEANKVTTAERFVLYAYLFGKPYAEEVDIDDIEFFGEEFREIKTYITEQKSAGKPPVFGDLYEYLDENTEGTEKGELSNIGRLDAYGKKPVNEEKYFYDCVRTLKAESLSRKIQNINVLLKEETDIEKRRLLTKEMTDLLVRKKRL